MHDTSISRTCGLLVLALALLATDAAAQGGGNKDCFKTALAARKAATRDAWADYWNEIGNCLNVSAPGETVKCSKKAAKELEEELDEIKEQFDARTKLCQKLGQAAYDPVIDPLEFTSVVDNPYFPLIPGRMLVYEGMTEDGLERVEETTLAETRTILGVECAVVHAVEFLEGEMKEDTLDYYAQHTDGSVWYFGELSFEIEDGYIVDMGGSWIAGEDGAKPGIIMLGAAEVGRVYRQEWLINEAEDIGTFLATGVSVTVPYNNTTTYLDCWKIRDTTPIEPDELEHKLFAQGIGLVQEVEVESGVHIDLIDIIGP